MNVGGTRVKGTGSTNHTLQPQSTPHPPLSFQPPPPHTYLHQILGQRRRRRREQEAQAGGAPTEEPHSEEGSLACCFCFCFCFVCVLGFVVVCGLVGMYVRAFVRCRMLSHPFVHHYYHKTQTKQPKHHLLKIGPIAAGVCSRAVTPATAARTRSKAPPSPPSSSLSSLSPSGSRPRCCCLNADSGATAGGCFDPLPFPPPSAPADASALLLRPATGGHANDTGGLYFCGVRGGPPPLGRRGCCWFPLPALGGPEPPSDSGCGFLPPNRPDRKDAAGDWRGGCSA